MSYHFTTAPEAYDYSYVKTVATLPSCSWRLIEVSDEARFERFQTPRYLSGFNGVVKADTVEAERLGLPTTVAALALIADAETS